MSWAHWQAEDMRRKLKNDALRPGDVYIDLICVHFPLKTGHSHSISLETGMVLVLIYLLYFNTAIAAAATNSVIA